MPRVRIPLLIVVAAVLAAILFLALDPARPVTTAIVDRGAVEEVIRAAGLTHVRRRYTVTVPLDGYLPPVPWHAGDRVRAGDVLLQMQPAHASFDPLAHEMALAEASRAQGVLAAALANTEATRKHAEFAQTGQLRLEQAFANGAATREELEAAEHVLKDARAHLRALEFAIDVARHELNVANLRVDHSREETPDGPVPVRTPLGGVVLSVFPGGAGEGRMTDAGVPLLEIGEPATLEVHTDVATADAMRLDTNSAARITNPANATGDVLQGRVRRIEPAAFTVVNANGDEEQRVRVSIEIISPREQWTKLGDGYPVNVEFVAWHDANVLRVPANALYQQEDRWMVLRVRGEHAYGTPVVIGHRGERYAEVLDGLAPGDVLVFDPQGIRDGARVAVSR